MSLALSRHLRLAALAAVLAVCGSSLSAMHALRHADQPAPASQGWQQRWVEVPTDGGPTLTIDGQTLFHTLASDFFLQDDGTVYVQTGDIPAMWLRDSAAQTMPYVRFAVAYPQLRSLVRGVVQHEARNILTDPYANAFTAAYKVWEQKWEVDSLAFPVTLLWVYWQRTHDRLAFTNHVHWMFGSILQTYRCEQHHDTCSHYYYGELPYHGRGAPFTETGMIWGGFRPSDDATAYPFNIPQNMLAVVALRELAALAVEGYGDRDLAVQALRLADEVQRGIDRYGRIYDMRYGWIYAYEVDGRGDALAMDDANLPNLLSAPYFGYVSSGDPLYAATRRFVLSDADPYFYHAGYAEGLGSPHTPAGWIWPLAIITRALTAADELETSDGIRALAATDARDGLVHESFDPRRPWRFTRAEFGWADAMDAELIFRTAAGEPAEQFMPAVFLSILPRNTSRTPMLAPRVMQWENLGAIGGALRQALVICALRKGRTATDRPCLQ